MKVTSLPYGIVLEQSNCSVILGVEMGCVFALRGIPNTRIEAKLPIMHEQETGLPTAMLTVTRCKRYPISYYVVNKLRAASRPSGPEKPKLHKKQHAILSGA